MVAAGGGGAHMASLSNFNETPNLLELIETYDARVSTVANQSICGDEAFIDLSLCADEASDT
jgi:hypothetical protein